jgi:ATP-binding cassette subfamily F protein uup
LLALDGKGSARRFVDFPQWEAARESENQATALAARAASARPVAKETPAQPVRKKLSWSEQRELEAMEENILAAEELLHARQEIMEDPTVLKDHMKLRDACTAVDAAQTRVAELYARWEELESRKG